MIKDIYWELKKKIWIICQNCKERFVQVYEKHTTVPISAYDPTRPFSRTGWSVPKGWPYYPSPTETLWGWLAGRQGDVRPAVKEDHPNTSPLTPLLRERLAENLACFWIKRAASTLFLESHCSWPFGSHLQKGGLNPHPGLATDFQCKSIFSLLYWTVVQNLWPGCSTPKYRDYPWAQTCSVFFFSVQLNYGSAC